MRVRRSKEEWARLMQEQKESGKSVNAFCEEKRIHPNLFYRKIKTTGQTSGFVKVRALKINNSTLTITCGNISVSISQPLTKEDIVLVLTSMKEAGYAELS